MSYAIFDENNNLLKIRETPEVGRKSLEIGKDIIWQIEIIRGSQIIQLSDKDVYEESDIMINRKKNIIARGGERMVINPDNMQNGDVVIREYEKERIKTNSNNDFLLKTDNELILEYKEKIIDLYTEKMDKKSIIDGTAQTKIDNLKAELDMIFTLKEMKIKYIEILSGEAN